MRDRLVSVGLFFLLLFIGAWAIPALLTRADYTAERDVRSDFPIAIEVNSAPKIIHWQDYAQRRAEYDKQLFIGADGQTYQSGESESFSMKRLAQNRYALDYHTDDYAFFAVYSVVNGSVQPESLRLNGPFGVLYGLGFAANGTWLFSLARRRARSRASALSRTPG